MIVYAPETPMAKELAKFESVPTPQCPKPGRPYQFREYPTMMYKPTRDARGIVRFDSQVAKDADEVRRLESSGFVRGGQGEALKALEARELEVAKAAANRVHGERRMSEAAKAEAAAVDDSTDQHVPEIPRTAITPRNRKAPAKAKSKAAKVPAAH